MTALQWILKEAKKLRKDYPKRFKTWREYVAQASAIYSSKHKGKSPVGKKKSAKKKVARKKVARKHIVGKVRKKKISEQSILNKIHRVKSEVNKLDEAQHKHMMGTVNKKLFNSLSEVKEFHKKQGGHWFDPKVLKFFNSRVESVLIAGKYFIYSSKMQNSDRYYQIAEVFPSGNIFPVDYTPRFDSKVKAKEYLMKKILNH